MFKRGFVYMQKMQEKLVKQPHTANSTYTNVAFYSVAFVSTELVEDSANGLSATFSCE